MFFYRKFLFFIMGSVLEILENIPVISLTIDLLCKIKSSMLRISLCANLYWGTYLFCSIAWRHLFSGDTGVTGFTT